jgi:hypothetical protein
MMPILFWYSFNSHGPIWGESDQQKIGFHFFQAWKLWIEDRPMELIDELIGDLCTLSNILWHIHVGLLCVQRRPQDRPDMSYVVQMLHSESLLPKARQYFSDSLEEILHLASLQLVRKTKSQIQYLKHGKWEPKWTVIFLKNLCNSAFCIFS